MAGHSTHPFGVGRRILDAFAGRVVLNVGDILPPNGDVEQVIRLGEMTAAWTPPP